MNRIRCLLIFLLGLPAFAAGLNAQDAPARDPGRIVQNADGRYWIFSAGDGIRAMSSETGDFDDWRVEATVFPQGEWPEWIDNYVLGFEGNFWAPDVIGPIDGTYYLYYSSAVENDPSAAIGLATATDLAGPWTDQGLVVAGDNAIDPAVFIEGDDWWLVHETRSEGIDLIRLDPETGLRLGNDEWTLVTGELEGPRLMQHDGDYYLFFQRTDIDQDVERDFGVQVMRSQAITGSYGGERNFLPNQDGRYSEPGHVALNFGRLTYRFYDGDADGEARLRATSMGWGEDGWPIPHATGAWDDGGYHAYWKGYPRPALDWVDTDSWLGQIYVGNDPWVYSEDYGEYLYVPPSDEGTPQGWIFVLQE